MIGLPLLALLSVAEAAEPVTYTWDPVVDTSITVAAGGTWLLLSNLVKPSLPTRTADYTLVKGVDTLALGRWDPLQARMSDILVGGTLATGLLITSLQGERPVDERLTSTAVVVQSVVVTQALTEVLKHAVDRPRPFTLITNPTEELEEEMAKPDAYLSFPSGHTSLEATVSFSVASVLVDRGVKPLPTWLGAAALTTTVATLRVGAGKHYPTDVLTGALLGTAVGLSVPALHRVEAVKPAISLTPSATPETPPTVNVTGVW